MTDLTTRSIETGTPGPAPMAAPVNGAAVADIRTLRQVTRAEQQRLSADADIERRARAAQLDLDLREQRRAVARREREADAAQQRARVEQRRTRRTARRARLRAAAPRWADRTLFVLPIMFPMAVAWVGQIRFAMTVMGWPLPAAVVFAAGFELSTAYVARLDWLSRAAGDSGLLFRGATWAFAAGAATMNYWHAADPGFAPTGEAVSYALMSITGVILWELLSIYRHRTALRTDGKLPAARPRFGVARWIWFHRITRLAWLLTLRDGHTTTEMAWRAALIAADRYGSPKGARRAIRAGHPVPPPEPLGDNGERDNAEHRDTGHGQEQRDAERRREDQHSTDRDWNRDSSARDEQRDGQTRPDDRDNVERDTPQDRPGSAPRTEHPMNSCNGEPTSEPDAQTQTYTAAPELPTARTLSGPAEQDETDPETPAANPKRDGHHGSTPRKQAAEAEPDLGRTGDDARPRGRIGAGRDTGEQDRDHRDGETTYGRDSGTRRPARAHQADGSDVPRQRRDSSDDITDVLAVGGAVGAQMLAYAQARVDEGLPVTGAELDRQFGTRDYGRKVLRRLTATDRGNPQ